MFSADRIDGLDALCGSEQILAHRDGRSFENTRRRHSFREGKRRAFGGSLPWWFLIYHSTKAHFYGSGEPIH